MIVVYLPAAIRDYDEIRELTAARSRLAAERTIDRIERVILQLAAGELSGSEVILRDGRRAQSWAVPPYRVYYRRTDEQTVILRIHHQARRPIERE